MQDWVMQMCCEILVKQLFMFMIDKLGVRVDRLLEIKET